MTRFYRPAPRKQVRGTPRSMGPARLEFSMRDTSNGSCALAAENKRPCGRSGPRLPAMRRLLLATPYGRKCQQAQAAQCKGARFRHLEFEAAWLVRGLFSVRQHARTRALRLSLASPKPCQRPVSARERRPAETPPAADPAVVLSASHDCRIVNLCSWPQRHLDSRHCRSRPLALNLCVLCLECRRQPSQRILSIGRLATDS